MLDRTHLEWPFFDDHHRQLVAQVDSWARSRHFGLERNTDAACRELAADLGAAGLLRHCVAGVQPGREIIDVRSLALCRETLAWHSGLADLVFSMQGLGSGPISLFGTAMQRAHYLPPVARGESIPAFALSEAGAGSDVGGITTAAVRDGEDYILEGQKSWISNAGIADVYVVFARTGDAPGARGLSAFIVDRGTAGENIAIERIETLAPHPIGRVAFRHCRVPAQQRLGEQGEGFKIAMATLDVFRTTVGAAALGLARRAMSEAVTHARVRHVFGSALSDFQITQAKIADMAASIDASALLVYRSAWAKDRGKERVTCESAIAKLFATEAAQRTIDDALQLFGAAGVVSGHIAESLYREIRSLRIYEGASEIQKLIIARHVLSGAAQ